MKITEAPIKSLKPYEKNAKKHDAKQIANVANSIRRFGWQQPIVIDDSGVVVIGHCRLLAAKKLGMETVPVTVASGLTEAEIRELRIADNKTNESEWDFAVLSEDAEGLTFDGFEGFDDILDLLDGVEVADPQQDDVPGAVAVDYNPRGIHKGQIWELGMHRVMCGSSTEKSDVDRLMGKARAKLLFTSPPYSDLRDYNGGKDLRTDSIASFIPCYAPFAAVQAVNLGITVRDNEIVPYWNDYIDAAHGAGLKLLSWNVWDKMMCGNIGQHKMMVPIRHEFIFVFGKERVEIRYTMPKQEASIFKNGSKKVATKRNKDGSTEDHSTGNTQRAFKKMESVLECPDILHLTSITKQTSETGKIRLKHPATFPVAFPSEYIVAFTEPTDIVVEPFCGSGTTLIACEQLGRQCFAMELDESFMNVIIDRWEEFTGQKAVLLADDKSDGDDAW